jgi:hypothetical protein
MTHSGFSSSAVDIEGAHLQVEALAFVRTRAPLIVVHWPKLMTCGLAAPKAALVSHARQKSMRDKKRYMLPAYASGSPQNKGSRHTNCNCVPNRELVSERLTAPENRLQ